jgi:TonB family protein
VLQSSGIGREPSGRAKSCPKTVVVKLAASNRDVHLAMENTFNLPRSKDVDRPVQRPAVITRLLFKSLSPHVEPYLVKVLKDGWRSGTFLWKGISFVTMVLRRKCVANGELAGGIGERRASLPAALLPTGRTADEKNGVGGVEVYCIRMTCLLSGSLVIQFHGVSASGYHAGVKKLVSVLILSLVFALSALAQQMPDPQLYAAALPTYPPLARAARIQGEVKIDFVLSQSGEPVSVTVISGHPMLRGAAEENVKTWKFHLPKDLFRTEWKYQTTFRFKLSDDNDTYDDLDASGNPKLTVVLDSFRYIEVITKPPSNKYARECPLPNEIRVPQTINAGDFVELSRSGCYGTCPAYEVRVSENGDVTWRGQSFVFDTAERHGHIGSEAAHGLIQQFLSPPFWGLCGGYSASITDNATTGIRVEIGGQKKSISNYASSAPQWVEKLEYAIDLSVNTHQWRHGDARTEPLTNIFQDSYYPKPGVTPLMKAAANADVAAMKIALRPGDEIDAVDSSGWTALMYAAASSHSEPVQFLLAAGANPNYKSPNGDTPLMASAVARMFDEDLQHAGADVNMQNSAGLTALMILAAEGEGDEVKSALNTGADPTLKDKEGRTALDYLHLANCGKSPIPEYHTFETGGKCDHLDEDDVKQVSTLLKSAKREKTARSHN